MGLGALALSTTVGACKVKNSASDIMIAGGQEISNGGDKRVLASTVEIVSTMADGGTEHCTGTVIGPRHVVTAAHCINPNQFPKVAYGANYFNHRDKVTVTGVTTHPKTKVFDKSVDKSKVDYYDIAVLSIQGLPPDLTPVDFAAPDVVQSGSSLILAGYGLTRENGEADDYLRSVQVTTKRVDLQNRFLEIADHTKRGSCMGDSGGPAYFDNGGTLQLVGAVQGGDAPCELGNGEYLMVNLYQGWMKCAFARQSNPLEKLVDDNSNVDCGTTLSSATSHSDTGVRASPSATDYPLCTNGSNTGSGYGWDPAVKDPKGSHSCRVP